MAAAAVKGLAQGVANLGNAAQDVGVGLLNVPAASVNFGAWVSETLIFDVPEGMKIRVPYIASPDWSKGLVTQESDFDHNVSKGCLEFAAGVLGAGVVGRLGGLANAGGFLTQAKGFGASGLYTPPVGMADDAVKAAYLAEVNSLSFRIKLEIHNVLTPFHRRATVTAVREFVENGAFGQGAFPVRMLENGQVLFGGSSVQTFINRQFFHHELIHVSQMVNNPMLWSSVPLRIVHEPIQILTAHGVIGWPTLGVGGWYLFVMSDRHG
jgi:hypothetical protein